MGYSTVNLDDIEGAGPGGAVRFVRTRRPVAGPDGMTMIGIGARRGNYAPRGPF
jgi:hypothetical protein